MKKLLSVGLLALTVATLPGWRKGEPRPIAPQGWTRFAIGGGGQNTNFDWPTSASPRLVTTDTGGAYKFDVGTSTWGQLISTNSLPSTLWGGPGGWMNGAYDIASAPSDPTICYLGYSKQNGDEDAAHVLKSTNCNAAPASIVWSDLTSFASACTSSCIWGSNISSYKATGRKIAVDPNNPNVVIVATPRSGQYVTINGGTSFAALNNVTASASNYPATGIAFDTSSASNCGAGSNQTCKVWICTHGDGCWRSTTGSTGTFSKQTSGTGPTNVRRGRVGIDGTYYACELEDAVKLWRFTTTWTDITPPGGTFQCETPVPSPHDATKLVMVSGSGSMFWATSVNTTPSWTGSSTAPTRASADVPWLAQPPSPAPQDFLAIADIIEDPTTPGKYWAASGVGVWYTTQAPGTGSVSYVGLTGGIEQLVINQIKSPVGGKPIVAAWDRATWYMSNISGYKTGYGPNYNQSIEMGWSIDCSRATPTFCVQLNIWFPGVFDNSGYSTDGGQTWTAFSTFPAIDFGAYIGGEIAVSDPGTTTAKVVFALGHNGDVYRTTNNGGTWTKVDAPTVFGHGAPNSGPGIIPGWHLNGRVNRQSLCADSGGGGVFYIYNSNDIADGGGFYRTTDTFTTASRMRGPFTGAVNQGGFVNQMECVPGKTGYVLYSGGQQGSSLFLTPDGGTNWPTTTTQAAITGPGCTPTDVYRVGVGKTKPGNDFPSVYIAATCGVTFSIWRSDNSQAEWNAGTAITWTNLGLPSGYMDEVTAVTGDSNTYGVVYIGGKGISNFVYVP